MGAWRRDKALYFGDFYLSTTEHPVQDSVGASGLTLTLRVRLVWLKRLIYYRLQFSTRVRLSGSVEIVNLTTASSTLQSSYQSLTNPYFLLPVEDEGLEGRFSGNTT